MGFAVCRCLQRWQDTAANYTPKNYTTIWWPKMVYENRSSCTGSTGTSSFRAPKAALPLLAVGREYIVPFWTFCWRDGALAWAETCLSLWVQVLKSASLWGFGATSCSVANQSPWDQAGLGESVIEGENDQKERQSSGEVVSNWNPIVDTNLTKKEMILSVLIRLPDALVNATIIELHRATIKINAECFCAHS